MKSLRRFALERLTARRPRVALQLSCAQLGVVGVEVRLPETSPLYRADGGETVSLPMDDVIAPYVLARRHWQLEELAFIQDHGPHSPCVLVDVGANVGLITRQLVHSLPQIAAALCFEPHPENFRRLKLNLAHLPQCRLIQAALGGEEGELRFYEDVANAGNYSLNADAMRGREYRTSIVRCLSARESAIVDLLPAELRAAPIIWKSDTQGFDELIVTSLEDSFWRRVHCGVMEISRIERPGFDRDRLGGVLSQFPIRRFGDGGGDVSVEECLAFADGRDNGHRDLFFART